MEKSQLTDEEQNVMFGGGTEAPFTGALLDEHRDGNFYCKNCESLLFASGTKFESGSGWPSFSEPANQANITLETDDSHGMVRTEVKCSTCGAHLGHLFDDGPRDRGGMRYCVNSLSLKFTPDKS